MTKRSINTSIEEADILDAVKLVFINNPPFGEIDAVADPDAILDKFNPVIPDAGMFSKPDPFPMNEPVNDPVNGKFILLN
mgnify:FL=1